MTGTVKKETADTKPDIETINITLKPGQKYPTPTPGVAERIFYETLYHQKPESHMAQEWCVLYGVLSEDEAGKISKLVQKRKLDKSHPSPAPKKSSSSGPSKQRKAKLDDDVSVDTGMGAASIYEGVGNTGI